MQASSSMLRLDAEHSEQRYYSIIRIENSATIESRHGDHSEIHSASKRISRNTVANDCFTFNSWDEFSRPACVVTVQIQRDSIFDVAAKRSQIEANFSATTSPSSAKIFSESHLFSVYLLEEQGLARQAARELMKAIELNLRKNQLASTNLLLNEIDFARVSSRTIAGMLRATFRVKSHLPAWETTYRRSWRKIREIGKSPESLFIGLPKLTEE